MSADRNVAISASGLAASYDGRLIWSGCDLAIHTGALVAVVGPNGSGKSTLFKLLLGLLQPAAGTLEVLGRRPRRGDANIGYIPQARHGEPELSVSGIDFVGLGVDGHRWGVPLPGRRSRARLRRVWDAVDAVAATSYAARTLTELSGGEMQRLHLAQALVGNPSLLLLDEPLSNLDVRNQSAMTELVATVARKRKLTVLLIAHDVNPLLPYVDTVIYVSHGKVSSGVPQHVITSESLSQIYDAPVEVLHDRRGRVFVVGLEEEIAHPHVAD